METVTFEIQSKKALQSVSQPFTVPGAPEDFNTTRS